MTNVYLLSMQGLSQLQVADGGGAPNSFAGALQAQSDV